MTSELQQCQQHYDTLPKWIQQRKTQQCLLKAIQIAEKALDSLKTSRELCDAIRNSATDLRKQLDRITKPEGQ